MQLILIRHGSPDYSGVEECHFMGHGRDFAKLSEEGIRQTQEIAKDKRLQGADIMLSSPYTRALETAAILSRDLNLKLEVEMDLHEWMPDTTFQNSGAAYYEKIRKEMLQFKGIHTKECLYSWESLEDLGKRAFKVIEKYKEYQKVIVVCHGVLIRQFTYIEDIPPCSIVEYEYNESSHYLGWQDLHTGDKHEKEKTEV